MWLGLKSQTRRYLQAKIKTLEFDKPMLNSVKRLAKRIARKDARQHDEIVYRIGLSAIKAARATYDNITRIQQADLQVFSQYGEDGIIDFLTSKLNIDKPTFVEIGTEDYSESNTRFLFQRTSTKGMIIDCDPALAHKVKNVLQLLLERQSDNKKQLCYQGKYSPIANRRWRRMAQQRYLQPRH